MNLHRASPWCTVVTLAALGVNFGSNEACAARPTAADGEVGVEVLTRGPVHEAFADTVTFDPEPGIVVPRAPPAAIEELPPEQRPEGDDVAWIPGYWAWDDERSDFLWVSGTWRALPPDRQWVSGYWGESGPDFQWISGYWADAETSEVEYLPKPPATVEVGPNIDAPSLDYTWLPGYWVWRDYRYAWRPGYWSSVEPDWVWVPAHYVWTPRGYVFIDGYWDYSIARRGVLFAPVYFHAGFSARPGYYYSPATVINPAVFARHLFLRPRYGHYYFGDYYDAGYQTAGFYPWFSYHNHNGYDPIYAHHRWQHRRDHAWERQVEADFRHHRDHEDARPARTWAAQRERVTSAAASGERGFVVAAPLEQLAQSADSPLRLRPLDKQERQRLAERGRGVHRSRAQRQQRETRRAATSADQPATESRPDRVKLPRSAMVAKSAAELGEGQAPPKALAAPDPDSQVERKPRRRPGKPETLQAGSPATGDQPPADARRPKKPGRGPKPAQAGSPATGDQPPADAPKGDNAKRDHGRRTPQARPTSRGHQRMPDAAQVDPKRRRERAAPRPQARPTSTGHQPPSDTPKGDNAKRGRGKATPQARPTSTGHQRMPDAAQVDPKRRTQRATRTPQARPTSTGHQRMPDAAQVDPKRRRERAAPRPQARPTSTGHQPPSDTPKGDNAKRGRGKATPQARPTGRGHQRMPDAAQVDPKRRRERAAPQSSEVGSKTKPTGLKSADQTP